MGGQIRDDAVRNILAWAALAKESGWSIRLWTELTHRQASPEIGFPFPLPISCQQQRLLQDAGVEIFPALRDALTASSDSLRLNPGDRTGLLPLVGMERYSHSERHEQPVGAAPWLAENLWDQAYGLRAFNYLSDISRYGILYAAGGIYVDVDIAPGNIDLRMLEGPLSEYEIPVYGPILRNKQYLDRERKAGLQAVGALPDSSVVTRAREEERHGSDTTRMPLTMMLLGRSNDRHDRLLLGNHFLVAQQHNKVLGRLLARLTSPNIVAGTIGSRRAPGLLSREAGMVSGPVALQEHIIDYLAPHARAAGNEPGALGFLDPRTHGLRTYAWDNARWLTEESESLPG
ncbi:glycosyltransferase [Streptomyces vinaceus]